MPKLSFAVNQESEKKPGISNACMEDWETGIETQYSVKSVTYTDNHQIVQSRDSQACNSDAVSRMLSNQSTPAGKNTEPIVWPSSKPANAGKMTEAAFGRPPMDEDELSDSDCDDGWDFGRRKASPVEEEAAPLEAGAASNNLATAVKDHPVVSVTWLQSVTKRAAKSKTAPGKSSAVPLWPETKLFSARLAEESRWWFQSIDICWRQNGSKMVLAVSQEMQRCFNSVENPYLTALYIVESSSDCMNSEFSCFLF